MSYERHRLDIRTLVQQVFKEQHKESSLVLGVLRTHWAAIVGEELARKTHPLRIERDTLWVGAGDACWAYELQFLKRELLNSVQTFIESRAIRELRFKAAELPEESKDNTTPGYSEVAPLPVEDDGALEQAAGAIADPTLRQAFRRSLGKQHRARKRQDRTPPDSRPPGYVV